MRKPEEVILVDSSDTDVMNQDLTEFGQYSGIPVAYVRSEPGLTKQRNRGVAVAKGDVVIFLDDDVVLEPGYVEAHVKLYEQFPEVGGIQGAFLDLRPERWLTRLLRAIFGLPRFGPAARLQRSGFPMYIMNPTGVTEVAIICGGNTSYRRQVLGQFQFDEWFQGYSFMEDDDFSYRVSQRWKLLLTPDAPLTHRHSPAARDNVIKAQRMRAINHYYVFHKLIPPSPLNWLAFWWSELGELIFAWRAVGWLGARARIDGWRLTSTVRQG